MVSEKNYLWLRLLIVAVRKVDFFVLPLLCLVSMVSESATSY